MSCTPGVAEAMARCAQKSQMTDSMATRYHSPSTRSNSWKCTPPKQIRERKPTRGTSHRYGPSGKAALAPAMDGRPREESETTLSSRRLKERTTPDRRLSSARGAHHRDPPLCSLTRSAVRPIRSGQSSSSSGGSCSLTHEAPTADRSADQSLGRTANSKGTWCRSTAHPRHTNTGPLPL